MLGAVIIYARSTCLFWKTIGDDGMVDLSKAKAVLSILRIKCTEFTWIRVILVESSGDNEDVRSKVIVMLLAKGSFKLHYLPNKQPFC